MALETYATDFERYLRFHPQRKVPENEESCIRQNFVELVEKEGKGGSPSVIFEKEAYLANEKDKYREFALITKEHIDAKGENDYTDLEIQSETLQKVLNAIISKRSQPGMFPFPAVFRKPYYALFHYKEAITSYKASESCTTVENTHLQYLQDFISDKFEVLDNVQKNQVGRDVIEFKHLGILFEAGCLVVAPVRKPKPPRPRREPTEEMDKTETPECFVFHHISGELEDKERGGKYVEIAVFRWGFDGTNFGLTADKLKIAEFPGLRGITKLDCYPWKSMPKDQKDKSFRKMVERGERWCKYMHATNCVYKGNAEVPERNRYGMDVNIYTQDMSGPVIVDYLAFMVANPEFKTPLGNRPPQRGDDHQEPDGKQSVTRTWDISPEKVSLDQKDLWRKPPKEQYKPTEAQALLCPALCYGYNLDQKKWGFFHVEKLRDKTKEDWPTNAMDELEINAEYRNILQPLVHEHFKSRSWTTSLNSRKGEGLIFLLHGPPGCGKTLTAERLAEKELKPLLRISCGDLGEGPYEFDQKLEALLKLALRALAIVLIDEADTFLAKRGEGGSRDYYQVAITSVFLKHLEYFPGVIFLTTNQKTELDPAVISRVISLHYNDLNDEARVGIWKRHLANAKEGAERKDIELICDDLGRSYKLDGRQIQILARVTLAWCAHQKKPISMDDIKYMHDIIHPVEKKSDNQTGRVSGRA